jgi:hypothetical protein
MKLGSKKLFTFYKLLLQPQLFFPKMSRIILILLFICFAFQAQTQPGQLSISRIDQMPDSPVPMLIRDWKKVAKDYDSFVFNLSKTGQNLPLSRFALPGQFNYSDNTAIFLDSYIGADDHLNQAEAINIIPAIVGASLAGIDKSNQDGINWVVATKDFFNLKNGQNIYLNNYDTHSGNDWWYDVMPNVYFYQLKYLYPETVIQFNSQFLSVADRWLNCLQQLGGSSVPWMVPSMNYRAFNLATGLPLTTGVPEPESAGSISWLLYNAYRETGNRKYFEGAQLAMDFLTTLESNPSYELQLPYGTVTAAQMNAIEGTGYPIQKLLDWCFNKGNLRDWGSIVGTWGGYDVSGLIGEANDNGDDYAFVMNGFQQAAALAPLPKYDKRYARVIAKWILNVTNASRLFYWNSLSQGLQDSYNWSFVYDPSACIPYESMKETWLGKSPFATGDAIRGGWASTNLSLYSGSSVGYLAALVNTTNVPEILCIDLNKTDFYGDNSLLSYLYFNPLNVTKQVTVNLPAGQSGVYDAITETILLTSANTSFQLTIPAKEVRLIRLYPSSLIPEIIDDRLYAGNNILDYHYNYNFSEKLRIKALSTEFNTLKTNAVFMVYCETGNITPENIEWFLNDVLINGQVNLQASFTTPSIPSDLVVRCRLSGQGRIIEDTLQILVVERIPVSPVINGIQSGSEYSVIESLDTFTAEVEPVAGDILNYDWSVSAGDLYQNTGSSVTWVAPLTPGVVNITVTVTNQDLLSSTFTQGVLVKDTGLAIQTPLIYYPFDKDNLNASSDRFHASVSGATKTDDSRGMPSLAYRFTSGQNIIYTENHVDLNFTEKVSISCWVRCEQLESERFIISHGSWQQRYKLSITPEGKLRWTVKTNTGVSDLDGSEALELNRYYHVTVLYTGYSMELYVNGTLDNFKPFSGAILASTKPVTIGRMDNVETQYALLGSVDEIKIWDQEIPVSQVKKLKNQWTTPAGIIEKELLSRIYPNPANRLINIEFTGSSDIRQISLLSADGRDVPGLEAVIQDTTIKIDIPQICTGVHFLKIVFNDGNVITKKIIIL